LSFGLKRKVLLATALMKNPPLLILDEPTTGLDPESRRNIHQLLLEKKKKGHTIFLTTHVLEEAEFLSDRFGIMFEGRILHTGTIDSLRAILDKHYELKFRKPSDRYEIQSRRFKDIPSAFSFIQGEHLRDFTFGSVSLESLYFELAKKT
jgi:ABC-2 type transport system ATP-binding protein